MALSLLPPDLRGGGKGPFNRTDARPQRTLAAEGKGCHALERIAWNFLLDYFYLNHLDSSHFWEPLLAHGQINSNVDALAASLVQPKTPNCVRNEIQETKQPPKEMDHRKAFFDPEWANGAGRTHRSLWEKKLCQRVTSGSWHKLKTHCWILQSIDNFFWGVGVGGALYHCHNWLAKKGIKWF